MTLPAAATAADGSSGLWQTMRRGTADTFRSLFESGTLWDEISLSNLVAGTLAANVTAGPFEDPLTGVAFPWPGAYTFYAYRGYIRLEGGRTYSFGSRFSNCVRLVVGGRTVLSTYAANATDTFGTFETTAPGWYPIDVRVGHTADKIGPDGDGTVSWNAFGLAMNADGLLSPTPFSAWTPLVDPGDGSLLRTEAPAAREVQLSRAVATGTTLALSGLAGAGETAAQAYVVYGGRDFGTLGSLEALEDLEVLEALESLGWTAIDLGAVPAADAATALAATVQEWGDAATVARFVLATGDALAWSAPATSAATALPALSGAGAVPAATGDGATFSATVFGGAGPYTVRVLAGTDSDNLSEAATATVAAAGPFSLPATGFFPGSTVYWRLALTDEAGRTAASDVFSLPMPGASRIFSSLDGDKAAWVVANPYTSDQNTITFGGTLTQLGAGETTVRLLRNGTPTGHPAAATTVPHEGEDRTVSSTGPYTLAVAGLPWDEDVTFAWSVSNGTDAVSYGPTATARDSGWTNCVTVLDATDYTWSGEAGALWTDAASWTPDGLHEAFVGFPRRGGRAVFPAGASATVAIPDFETPLRFSQLSIGAGADVTFTAAPGAANAFLKMQRENASTTPRAYSLSLAQGASVRITGDLDVNFYYNADGTFNAGGTDTTLTVDGGARVALGYSNDGYAYATKGNARSLLAVTNGATLTATGYLLIDGAGSQMVVDDATVVQTYSTRDGSRMTLRGKTMNGKATLVIRGAHPVLQVGRNLYVNTTSSPDKEQYIDFEVPEEGWADAPIRTVANNAYVFGADCASGYSINLRIPATAPAAVAGKTLDVPLVRWPKGINATYVTLDAANLPHPATDSFYTETDPATGQTIVWAHLAGGVADTDAPQAVDFQVAALGDGTATMTFQTLPGSGGATALSAVLLDAEGAALAGASVSLSVSSVSATETVTAPALTAAEGSPEGFAFSSSKLNAGTSTIMSMRSRRGPETRPRYCLRDASEQVQRPEGWPYQPHLQGFMAQTSMKRLG